MVEEIEKACTGCHGCRSICPAGAVEMKNDKKGFLYPAVDAKKCMKCGLCRAVCPVLHRKEERHKVQALACIAKDGKVRIGSSSGGVFSLLAGRVLAKGGVVFGAAFDENWMVRHTGICRIEELYRLCGAKYVQSVVNDVFCDVRRLLEEGRTVYFSGTPCQVDGLKCFLQKEYEQLICQDVICHGVGAPAVWEKYLTEKIEDMKENICKINFRDKETGWNSYQTKIEFSQKQYCGGHQTDSYMKLYLNNVILRPSCYSCRSKSVWRNSDITLADFWGVGRFLPELDDDRGTSLVLLNSEKGKHLFREIDPQVVWKRAPLKKAIRINRNAYHSVSCPKQTDSFWQEWSDMDMEALAERYGTVSLPYLLKEKISSMLELRKQFL